MSNKSSYRLNPRELQTRSRLSRLALSAGLLICLVLLDWASGVETLTAQELRTVDGEQPASVWMVRKTEDFEITGEGTNDAWNRTEWVTLTRRSNPSRVPTYQTRAKLLYSDRGIYLLFDNRDHLVTATMEDHFQRLWQEDVIELFLWTDPTKRTYFEYELSPLNRELPIIVDNVDGELTHWLPYFHSYYEEHPRKTDHAVAFRGLEMDIETRERVEPGELDPDLAPSGETITGWSAEVFIPFDLLAPLENRVPSSGTTWRANLYRIDYDEGSVHWSWQPYRNNFHDIARFGTLLFE